MASPERNYAEVGDLRVFYLERGTGTPVILLHGGLATAELSWNDPIDSLAGSYRVLAPDSRGHGRTGNLEQGLNYALMADDVAGFIDGLGLDRPVLVGYSDGAQVAIEFGLRHPGKARALVFGGAIAEMTPTYLDMLHSWGFPSAGEVDLRNLEQAFGGFFETINVAHAHVHGSDYWRQLLHQISRLWLTTPTYDAATLGQIREPTLVIAGDRDGAAAEQMFGIFRALPQGELAVVPRAEHDAVNRPVFWPWCGTSSTVMSPMRRARPQAVEIRLGRRLGI